jgi:2-succinyl-5-enolpyruvyl-6-hydroxy-3-cyclohexene-1-carboxylate synthase
MNYNNNFLRSKIIVNILQHLGLRDVCISPGSRSTPITLAFARNEQITKHIIVDERSSGFFALGIAKATKNPVAVVCTSGTAAVELYPAIVEAYTSQVPLIVITADRPSYLRYTGSNQTINQENLFSANCDFFYDLGLPSDSFSDEINLAYTMCTAYSRTLLPYKGPVHINLPFEKPLEPDSLDRYLSEKNELEMSSLIQSLKLEEYDYLRKLQDFQPLDIRSDDNILILLGNKQYYKELLAKCISVSEKLKIPLCIESSVEYPELDRNSYISNLGNLLGSYKFTNEFKPDKIIIFGRNFTSKNLERFLNTSEVDLIIVNPKGECYGKYNDYKTVLQTYELEILDNLESFFTGISEKREKFYNLCISYDKEFGKLQKDYFTKKSVVSEVETIALLTSSLQLEKKFPVFFSNSLPVRDFDYIKHFSINPVFINRGASGIDGIVSTSLGISKGLKLPVILITGDLAFHYDINALQLIQTLKIPILIVLFNNDGGSIFDYLPIYSETEEFQTYFKTPININFGKIVEAYGLEYRKIEDEKEFELSINNFIELPRPVVLELKFDSIKSKERKDHIKNAVISSLEKLEI